MRLFGPLMVLLFCLSQAFRDVYLGNVFQRVDFLTVILLAFIPSSIFFAAFSVWRSPSDWPGLASQWRTILAMNITTGLAWTSYFFGLASLEPAVVNTLHSGIGPLTVIMLAMAGFAIAGKSEITRTEAWCHAGTVVTLAGVWVVVLGGWSGISSAGSLPALMLLVMSGASITISHLYSKRMHEAGFGSETITAVRYGFIILGAAIAIAMRGKASGVTGVADGVVLGAAAALLIALPLYILQLGVSRTPQLTAHVIRSLGPVFVFALEQLDGRLSLSFPVLAMILLYSAFIIAANITHGWRS